MTKEIKITLAFLVLFFALLIFPTTVNATNVTYKTEYFSSIETAIYVDGLDNNLEEGYDYYIYITQDSTTDIDTVTSKASMAKCDSLQFDSASNQFYLKTSAHNMGIFEKAGDYYAFIVKGQVPSKSSFSLIDGPTKLERPKLLANGKRIEVSFSQNGMSYFINQYDYYTKLYGTDRKVNFYLGKIEDENLLIKLSEKTSDAYDVLYNYAKKNNNYLYSGAFDTTFTGVLKYNIWKDYTGFKNGDYYFVYYKLDNENGKYAEMDDVQAYTVNNSGILDEFATYVAKDDNKEPSDNKPSNDTTTSQKPNINDSTQASGTLPYTGVSMRIIVAIVLVLIWGIIAYFKYNRLKDI